MPTIPEYNQSATEEAGLTRAKRRVIKSMESGIVKLTEKPDVDLTSGEADDVATRLISQFEDLTALFRQINAYFGSGEGGDIFLDQPSDIVKAFGVVIVSAKLIARILRIAKSLVPMMRYMDLGVLSDLKAVQQECHESAVEAFSTLRRLDFQNTPTVDDESSVSTLNEIYGDFYDEYDPNEPTGNTTVGSIEYSIQSDPTGGLPSKISSKRRGRPPKEGSKAYLLRQANDAVRQLKQAEEDRKAREEGLRLLLAQADLNKEEGVTQDSDDISALTEDSRQGVAPLQVFKRIDISTYRRLVDMMAEKLSRAMDLLDIGYNNFNKHRNQKVFRLQDDDVGENIKTASGFSMVRGSRSRMSGGKVYKVGGSSALLYEREGLPRFL
jgi:hypothetical protein